MKKNALQLLLLMNIFVMISCSTTKPLEHHYTFEDKQVFDLINNLKKNPNDAASAKLDRLNHGIADPQATSLPASLFEAFDSTDHNVGAKSSSIKSHLCHGSIRCNQQRKNVEAVKTLMMEHARVMSGGLPHEHQCFV